MAQGSLDNDDVLDISIELHTAQVSSRTTSRHCSESSSPDDPVNQIDLLTPGFNLGGVDNPGFSGYQSPEAMNNLGAVVQIRVDERSSKAIGAKHHPGSVHKGYPRSIGLSILYALLLVLLGLVVPTTEAITGFWLSHHFVGAFLVYIYGVSIVFLIYLQCYHVSIHTKMTRESQVKRKRILQARHKRAMATASAKRECNCDNIPPESPKDNISVSDQSSEMDDKSNVGDDISMAATEVEQVERQEIQEYITLKHGTASMSHEGTSFYLRLGCLIFAIGNLILVALKIEYEFSNSTSNYCENDTLRYTSLFHMGFIIVQTFFLFKTHRLSIHSHKSWVRLGMMHVLATNFCVWLRVMVEEVMHSIVDDVNHFKGSSGNETSCIGSHSTLLAKASPYLFPFVLEYSLVAVASMASLFADMNVAVTRDIIEAVRKALRHAYRKGEDLFESIQLHHGGHEVAFQKAHQGTFIGMIVMSGVLVSIVLFHFWGGKDGMTERADLTFQVCDLILNTILLIGTIVGVVQLYPLGYDLSRENHIDHYLLITSAMGLIVLELFSIGASFIVRTREEVDPLNPVLLLNIVSGLLAIIQAIVQAMFIADGMQRVTLNEAQHEQKPGRGAVSFLVVCNVATWVFKSFLEKSLTLQHEKVVFGSVAWPLVLDTSLPLLLFFRFHSSICLADMWRSVYEPEKNVIETEFLD